MDVNAWRWSYLTTCSFTPPLLSATGRISTFLHAGLAPRAAPPATARTSRPGSTRIVRISPSASSRSRLFFPWPAFLGLLVAMAASLPCVSTPPPPSESPSEPAPASGGAARDRRGRASSGRHMRTSFAEPRGSLRSVRLRLAAHGARHDDATIGGSGNRAVRNDGFAWERGREGDGGVKGRRQGRRLQYCTSSRAILSDC